MDQTVSSGRSWGKIWDSSYVEKSSKQVHDLFHFPAGTTHTLCTLEWGGEVTMCFYLGVGRSVV